MRVALNVEQLLYRAPGGIGRYTAKLMTLLPGLSADDTIMAFTARHGAAEVAQVYSRFGLDGADVAAAHRLPLPRALLYPAWNSVGLPRLNWLCRALAGVDVVHAPSVAVPGTGPRTRLVVTVHDAGTALFPHTFPRRGRWFHERGLAAAARRADLVITVSHAAAAEIDAHTAIPASRVRVVHNGVDTAPALPDEIAGTLARYGLSDRPYVLWVGTLEPRKNVGTLVAAFAQLGRIASDHQLVLVGPSGWLEAGLVGSSDRDRLGDRLHSLGQVTDVELRALYAGADVFAFPSHHEGFGLPVLEAMAQGTPVICADIPALREVSGGAARLVPPESVGEWTVALEDMLDDETARQSLAAAGPRQAGLFSWASTARATHAVYAESMGG